MIVLHHLNHSRSTRILWMLEEIGLPYRLVAHERLPGLRAPPALRALHPAGKAPVIEDDGLVLAESSVILAYLDDRYGGGRLAPPFGTPDRARHDEWLHFVEGTAVLPLMIGFYGDLTGGLSPIMQKIRDAEAKAVLDRIEQAVTTKAFLTSDRLTLADIQISWLIEFAFDRGLLAEYPAISVYRERLLALPAYVRALEVGGPVMLPKR